MAARQREMAGRQRVNGVSRRGQFQLHNINPVSLVFLDNFDDIASLTNRHNPLAIRHTPLANANQRLSRGDGISTRNLTTESR